MPIRVTSSGSFENTMKFGKRVLNKDIYDGLKRYGQQGVDALSNATPRDSGITAESWSYRIINRGGRPGLEWYNRNEHSGENIAILIQYGHGTGTGGYVAGRDFINPAIRPIFDQIANEVWEQVKR